MNHISVCKQMDMESTLSDILHIDFICKELLNTNGERGVYDYYLQLENIYSEAILDILCKSVEEKIKSIRESISILEKEYLILKKHEINKNTDSKYGSVSVYNMGKEDEVMISLSLERSLNCSYTMTSHHLFTLLLDLKVVLRKHKCLTCCLDS